MSGGLASAIWWDCTLVISADADWVDYVRKNREDSTWFHHNHVPLVVFFDTLVLQPPSYRFRVLCGFQIESPETEMGRMGRMGTEFFFWGNYLVYFAFAFAFAAFAGTAHPT